MNTVDVNGERIAIVYTDDTQLAVYPDDDLDPHGYVEQAQTRFAGQPVPHDIVKRYFWWYRFLLLNKDYAACCRAKGQGNRYAAFYADWGDIFALPFPEWWERHGRRIARLDDWLVKDVSEEPNLETYQHKPDYLLVAVKLDALSGNRNATYEAVTALVRRRLDQRKEIAIACTYTADQCSYELLKWAYDAYVGHSAQDMDAHKPDAGVTVERINVPRPSRDVDVLDRRKVNDLRRTAEQIIRNALEMARFPVHDRRTASLSQ